MAGDQIGAIPKTGTARGEFRGTPGYIRVIKILGNGSNWETLPLIRLNRFCPLKPLFCWPGLEGFITLVR